jgi:PAS domain S-box-containing protein
MPRKLTVIALIVVGLHICEVLFLGTSLAGSLLANSLQIFASGVAATMCFGARRRSRGMARPFWLLIGCGIATWGVANIGWLYYEVILRAEPPTGSFLRFIFGIQLVFFAMALCLDPDKDSPQFDLASLLDFTQLSIVFYLIFLGLYYVPALHSDQHAAKVRELWVEVAENTALIALSLVGLARCHTKHIRPLYTGLAIYLTIYTVGSSIADYQQSIGEVPTGTWFDLLWTLPLLWGAFWAAGWQPSPSQQPALRLYKKTFGAMLLTNMTFAFAPLIILLQIAQLGSGWRFLRFSLLGVSILCFAARLALSEYREAQTANTARRNALAMDFAINGMAILDAAGSYIYANPAYARMMGYANPEALIGKPWREISNPQDVTPIEADIRNALKQHGKWFGPLTAYHEDGAVVPLEMAIASLPDGGTICVSRDVSERRKAERERKETEVKYRMLVEQVAAVSYIAELGVHGEWLYVSPQVEQILGYTQAEWLADSVNWTQHVPVEDHPLVEAAENASARGEAFRAEYRIICKDGHTIWVSDNAVTVRGSDAHPVMEGLIVDITERKQLETRLQQSSKMEAVGRLAGGIAHDFNNLLTIIKGYTELALNRVDTQLELRSDIERIENASERAAMLVRQLLAFSRKQVLQPKTLDLNSIVLNLDKLLRRLMDEHIEMITHVDENLGAVKADPAQVEQVVMNLVVNARDAMPKGGRLTVETSNVELDSAFTSDHTSVRPGRYVMLAISDTGTGMDADTVAHIFEPFYTTKESSRGTGLGLSTVYGIVKQSGGYIWVYSEPGQGSTFKVYLPRVDEAVPDESKKQRDLSNRRGTETILLVEDEEAVRELTRIVLAAQGYNVVMAEIPAEAERICETHSGEIHLLLTDVMMPGISGRELASRVSALRPNIRVLFMSGYTDNVIAQGGMLEEGIAFLQKPFTPAALVRKVRDVLNHAPAL